MLPGIGFGEYLIIGIVALVVIGPRELPKLARMVAGYIRQARGLARDFQKSFDEMGRQLELDELRKEVDALKRGEPFKEVTNELKGLERDLKSVTPDIRSLPTSRPTGPAQIPQSRPTAAAPSTPAAPPAAPGVSEPARPEPALRSVSEPAGPLADEAAAPPPAEERRIGGI
jgi:sec-independent protein translocase protein TatB